MDQSLVRRLAFFDQEGVLGDQAGVVNQRDIVGAGDLLDRAQVVQRERLPAHQVRGRFHPDVDDLVAVLRNCCAQLVQIHVALEQVAAGRLQPLVGNQLQHRAAGQLDVRSGGGEMVVHDDHRPRLDEHLGEQVLGRAALVHRHRPVEPHHLFDGRRQPGEALRAGIGVIRHHHRAQLVIAHGVGAAVGQHVEEDIAGGQQEGVVAGVSDRGQAVTDGGKGGLLDNAHFVHLHRDPRGHRTGECSSFPPIQRIRIWLDPDVTGGNNWIERGDRLDSVAPRHRQASDCDRRSERVVQGTGNSNADSTERQIVVGDDGGMGRVYLLTPASLASAYRRQRPAGQLGPSCRPWRT